MKTFTIGDNGPGGEQIYFQVKTNLNNLYELKASLYVMGLDTGERAYQILSRMERDPLFARSVSFDGKQIFEVTQVQEPRFFHTGHFWLLLAFCIAVFIVFQEISNVPYAAIAMFVGLLIYTLDYAFNNDAAQSLGCFKWTALLPSLGIWALVLWGIVHVVQQEGLSGQIIPLKTTMIAIAGIFVAAIGTGEIRRIGIFSYALVIVGSLIFLYAAIDYNGGSLWQL